MSETHTHDAPGPKGTWLLGSADDFKSDPLNFMIECHRKYGDVVAMRMGTLPMLMISDPDLIHQVLVAKASSFTKDAAIKNNAEFFGNGLLRSEGEYWKRNRKLASASFSPRRLEQYGQEMIEICNKKIANWNDGEIIDLEKELMRLTLSIAAKTLFDTGVEDNDGFEAALLDAQKYLSERMEDFIVLLLPEWIPVPTNIHLKDAIHRVDRVVYKLIQERRGNTEGRIDLLSSLINVQDEDGSKLSDKEIRDEVFTLFFAGHETTSLTMTWTYYLLSQHPEIEEKLLNEINSVLQNRSLTTGSDAHQFDYARKVIRESMRMLPPVWVIGREAAEDCQIGDYEVKKGTSILISQWVNNQDSRWFSNPEQFNPERWTPEFCEALPKFAYFPFGGGPRTCIGNNFALMEAVLLLVSISRNFHLDLESSQKVELHPAVTLRPRTSIMMKVKKR